MDKCRRPVLLHLIASQKQQNASGNRGTHFVVHCCISGKIRSASNALFSSLVYSLGSVCGTSADGRPRPRSIRVALERVFGAGLKTALRIPSRGLKVY